MGGRTILSLGLFLSTEGGERNNPKERGENLKQITVTEATAKAILALAESLEVPSELPVVVSEPSAPVVVIPSGSPFQLVSEPSAPIVTVPSEPSAPTLSPSEKAVAKAAKREFNQRLNSQINGQLANATKAVTSGDSVGAANYLTAAMELVPSHWDSTLKRVIAKAQSLGFAKV